MMNTTSWVMVWLGAWPWLLVMVTNVFNRRRLAFTPGPYEPGPQGNDVPCSVVLVRAAVAVVVTVVTLLWAQPVRAQCTVECRAVPEPAVVFYQVFLPVVGGDGMGVVDGRVLEKGPVLGPGPCSSETPWGCYRVQVWLPVIVNEGMTGVRG